MNILFGSKRKPINRSEILLAGTARNVANFIEKDVNHLTQCLTNFKKVHGLIIESDSNDNTVEVLSRISSQHSNIAFISLGNLSRKKPKRTDRLAFCRNRIIEELRNNSRYANVDYVALADLDSVNHDLTSEKIHQCWDVKEDWDVITANQAGVYYDLWALRHPDWCPSDYWEHIRQLEKIFDEKTAHDLAVNSRVAHLRSDRGLIAVDSAFGGFAIYQRAAFLAGTYSGLNAQGKEICEHVPFHAMLKNQGYQIYINTALINCDKPAESQAQPLPSKLRTSFSLNIIQSLGNRLFGKKRFNKYLELLKNRE